MNETASVGASAPVLISSGDATQHGLAPLTIRYDTQVAALVVRRFPTSDTYVALSGLPGGANAIIVWDCTNLDGDVGTAIRGKSGPPWTKELTLGIEDRAVVFGAECTGMTYSTGSGRTRMDWFGILVKRPHATALVSFGVGGRDGLDATASDVLANGLIAAALKTLALE
jgi:hypothetical protein